MLNREKQIVVENKNLKCEKKDTFISVLASLKSITVLLIEVQ